MSVHLDGELAVEVNGTVIGTSTRAVEVLETKHRPVWYMPLEDLDATLIEATETDTFCPFKGHASYWSVKLPDAMLTTARRSNTYPFGMPLAQVVTSMKSSGLLEDQSADGSSR